MWVVEGEGGGGQEESVIHLLHEHLSRYWDVAAATSDGDGGSGACKVGGWASGVVCSRGGKG